MTKTRLAIVCAALLVPTVAYAQTSDDKYCKALTETWRKTNPLNENPLAEVPNAIAKCNAGDTAAGIPVLEKALKNAKVELPPRT